MFTLKEKTTMRHLLTLLIVSALTFSCSQKKKSEEQLMMEAIDFKVRNIDRNHRVQIIEMDSIIGDSLYKVRGYFAGDEMLKVVGILRTAHFERDDYFYFENHEPLFSGHMINFRDDRLAEEFKYYYEDEKVTQALAWEDHYTPGKRFPHEHFEKILPNQDSLLNTEQTRLIHLLHIMEMSHLEIKHLNENRGANN